MSAHKHLVLFLALTAAAATAVFLNAQDSMERIVAVVGSEIILKSDIDGAVEMYAQRFPNQKKNDPAFRQSVLDQMINERLIMLAAQEDTLIDVSDDEVTQRMDYQLAMLVQQVGSEKRIEDVYGMSIARIKREFREEIRKQLLIDRMRQKKFGQVKASHADVEAFYNKYKDSIPSIPARVDLYHIVRYVKPSAEQNKEAYELALRIRDSIVKGGSFADFARRYSADPGSAANGGDLGFVEKGKFVASFEAAAFALGPNQMSEPVETPFGWHIIQLIDKSASSINCRHILIKISQSEADREKSQKELNEIRDRALKGESFEQLARDLSDEKETQGFGGSMGQLEFERIQEEKLRELVKDLPDGGITEPLPYVADPMKPGYHIVYRKKLIPSHAAELDLDYQLLEQLALREKKQRLENEFTGELRKRMYWEQR